MFIASIFGVYSHKKTASLYRVAVVLFYPCFFACAGDRMFAIASAAVSSADLIAWAYIRVVVLALACPRRCATVVKGVPAAICKVAFVCRKP